jgi:phosphatidate phosphatase APP1
MFLNQLKKDYDFLSKNLKNLVSNRFISIKTQSNADVYLVHNNIKIHTKTLTDGYFKFCIPLEQSNDYGWIDYEVSIIYKNETIITKESYIRPSIGNLGIISDIDDTF